MSVAYIYIHISGIASWERSQYSIYIHAHVFNIRCVLVCIYFLFSARCYDVFQCRAAERSAAVDLKDILCRAGLLLLHLAHPSYFSCEQRKIYILCVYFQYKAKSIHHPRCLVSRALIVMKTSSGTFHKRAQRILFDELSNQWEFCFCYGRSSTKARRTTNRNGCVCRINVSLMARWWNSLGRYCLRWKVWDWNQ